MIYSRINTTILLSLVGVLSLCAQTQKGKASFYSKRATGSRSSSGERLHHDSLTCAHRTHPFGTLLRVTNERNGKEVVVRVTDRGPHSRGRIIDLSHAAAKELGIINQGVAVVRVEPLRGNMHVPYKPEPEPMPEIDFEVTEYTLPENGVLHFPKHGKQYKQYVKTVDDDEDTVAKTDSIKKPATKKPVVKKASANKQVAKKSPTRKTSSKKSSARKRKRR